LHHGRPPPGAHHPSCFAGGPLSSSVASGESERTGTQPGRKRTLFLALTALMYGFVLVGFWPYWRALGASEQPRPWIIHLHAAVFTGWMALLLAQVLLVRRRQLPLHRRLGQAGIYYGVVVFLLGVAVTAVAPASHVLNGEWTLDQAAGFVIYPAGDMLLFGTLFGAAVAYRKRPETHKRLILLATVALMFAPVARWVGEAGPWVLLAVWLSPALLAMAADWRRTRRVHAALLIGTAWLVVVFARVAFESSPAWLAIGRGFVLAVTPTVARIL
jgi:hypothetical protein